MSHVPLSPPRVSRRDVVHGLAAGASVLLAAHTGTLELFAQDAARSAVINAFIAIAPDGTVTLQCAHSEMGQGISTTFTAIIADELEADWSKCETVFSTAGKPYRHPVYDWSRNRSAPITRSSARWARRRGKC